MEYAFFMSSTAEELKTVGEIAAALGKPKHVITYAIDRHGIRETRRAGIARLFDAKAVEAIKAAMAKEGGRHA